MNDNKIIAFYLPQYHPTPRNNEWWGKGFTEWTNVGKAKPLYPGHYQPKVPSDLGYYDLRLAEVREAQATMAKENGIYGFCYYHYWFENGFEELEHPFDEVVKLGQPDFPFCLCWANESWYSKFWNMDGTVEKNILAEQKYLGTEDNLKHFKRLLPAFRDKRYIKVGGKVLFVIYRPYQFQNLSAFMQEWNALALENGLDGFYFVGYSMHIKKEYDDLKRMGFNSVISCRLYDMGHCKTLWERLVVKFQRVVLKYPEIENYKKYYKDLIGVEEEKVDVWPTIVPNWDHTPRSGRGGMVFSNATPETFDRHAAMVHELLERKDVSDRFAFLKSWNEWGEGNFVEPDLKYGMGFLKVIKKYFG